MRGGEHQRLALRACQPVDGGDRLVAEPAFGGVDDPFEGKVVRRAPDQPEIGERVADFSPFVKAEPADDLIGEADRDEAIFEFAGLELGPNEDCDLVETASGALVRLDFLADPARLLGPVPHSNDLDRVALRNLGPERLAKPPAVLRDQSRGGAENMRGRTIILLEPDYRRAGKFLFEAQDVGDFGPSPGIDRLVVVADAAQVAAGFGEQLQPLILDRVGVLIFVDEDVTETLAIAFEHVGMLAEDRQHVEQQVAEVAGVQSDQTRLIRPVHFLAATAAERFRFSGVDLVGGQPLVLPPVDQPRQLSRRPALFVELRRDDQLLE